MTAGGQKQLSREEQPGEAGRRLDGSGLKEPSGVEII